MISIIIPVFNCREYIEQCIDSIVAANHDQNLEILLIDDGSDDGSGRVCDRQSEKYSCIKVFHQKNRGVSAARNIGLDNSVGEWIMFIDADDKIPAYTFECFEKYINSDVDWILGSVLTLGEADPMYLYFREECAAPSLLAYEIMCTPATKLMMSGVWGKLFRREIINMHQIRFDTSLKNGEDGKFVIEYLTKVDTIRNMRDFPPVYYLIRYPIEERASAVSYIYPDFFIFYLLHSTAIYEYLTTQENQYDMKKFFQSFINELIIHLVRAYAYHDFFEQGQLTSSIRDVTNNDLVRKAIRQYKRIRKSDSALIPLAIRLNNSWLLDAVLKKRGIAYARNSKQRGKKTSIYR